MFRLIALSFPPDNFSGSQVPSSSKFIREAAISELASLLLKRSDGRWQISSLFDNPWPYSFGITTILSSQKKFNTHKYIHINHISIYIQICACWHAYKGRLRPNTRSRDYIIPVQYCRQNH